MIRSNDMNEGLPIIIEASLRSFLQRMGNAPGADGMEQWMEKFMEAEVRPHEVDKLLERFATPEKAVLRFLDFIEAGGFARV